MITIFLYYAGILKVVIIGQVPIFASYTVISLSVTISSHVQMEVRY